MYVAETALEMDHLTPGQALRAHTAKLHADALDEVLSEQDDGGEAEPPQKYGLKWLRWKVGQQHDFLNEENMVSQLIHARGHLCIFLPKFHCDLNWAENHWGKAKPFVRTLCDGTWLAMCQGIWLAFGEGNINDDLCQRFARKIREIIRMYDAGIDGPFAEYCQRKFNQHRLPFHDAASLAQWGPNSIATATKNAQGRRKLSCRVTSIDVASGSCCVEFMDGGVRNNVRLEDLGRVADNATIRR